MDEYIEEQKSPQKEVCEKLRELILAAAPGIREEVKWGVPNYGDSKYYIVALKDHVNLGFALKGLSEEEQRLLEGTGKTMKHVKIRSLKEIEEKRVAELLRLTSKK